MERIQGYKSRQSSKKEKRLRREGNESNESEEGEPEQTQRVRPEKFIAIIRFNEKGQENMKKINPFLLTTNLAGKIGEIQFAKVLNDGNLLVRCNSGEQIDKALKLKEIGNNKVVSTMKVGAQNEGGCKGVITGVPMNVRMEELKKCIKGGNVKEAQRLKTTKEGVKKDSGTVMIEFEGENVLKRVFLGFVSFPVRVYVPKPLRCFNCQKFGHTAKNCKEKSDIHSRSGQ